MTSLVRNQVKFARQSQHRRRYRTHFWKWSSWPLSSTSAWNRRSGSYPLGTEIQSYTGTSEIYKCLGDSCFCTAQLPRPRTGARAPWAFVPQENKIPHVRRTAYWNTQLQVCCGTHTLQSLNSAFLLDKNAWRLPERQQRQSGCQRSASIENAPIVGSKYALTHRDHLQCPASGCNLQDRL